jgi:hypothetical protein
VVVSMSTQEFSRLEVLLGNQSGRLRIEDVCSLIGSNGGRWTPPTTEKERDEALARVAPTDAEALGVTALSRQSKAAAPQETWVRACASPCMDTMKARRCLLEVRGLTALVKPILTASVDGICVAVFCMTIWEQWTPAKWGADLLFDLILRAIA